MEQLHTILDKNNYIINSYRDYFLSYYGNKSDFVLSAILPYGLRWTKGVGFYIKEMDIESSIVYMWDYRSDYTQELTQNIAVYQDHAWHNVILLRYYV